MSESHRKPKPVRQKKHWALRLLGWAAALLFLGVIGAVGTFFLGYATTDIPDPNKEFQTNTTVVYWGDGTTEMGTFFEHNRKSLELKQIPKSMQDAAIAAEDRTFWTNPGVSPSGMVRAAWNTARGRQLQGGSTITQQYVKILYLTQDRTFSRKFEELFIATKLSRSEDKESILEGYLNTIYFGEGAYGVEAAAQAYFNKSFLNKDPRKRPTIAESAYLATVLNNPSRFDPTDSKAAAARTLERYRYVLDGMRLMGTITEQQYTGYSRALPKITKKKKNNRYQGTTGFLLDMTRLELERLGYSDDEIVGGGLRVTTTFDKGLQKKMVEAVQEAHPDDMVKDGIPLQIGMASVRPDTGELAAVYGGSDFLKSQLNWATARARPGSSFKPFAVAAALKDGRSLSNRYHGNSPILVNGEAFNNEFDHDYGGRVSLLRATEESINTAFYDLVDNDMKNGPSKVVDAAIAAGIPDSDEIEHDRPAPSNVLGPNAYASPVDMAAAYSTFATNGIRNDVHSVKTIKDAEGKVMRQIEPSRTRAFDEDVAADTTFALQRVVDSGTGRAQASKIDRPAAGKTGTAGGSSIEVRRNNAKCKVLRTQGKECKMKKEQNDTLTSWWVGYTPQLSTAVLYRAGKEGESDLDPFSENQAFFGGNWPARTWLAFMEPAHEGLDDEEFPKPSKKARQARDDRSPTRPSKTPTGTPTNTPTATSTPTRTEPTDTQPTETKPTKTKPTKPTTKPPITLPTKPPTTTPPSGG